MKSACLMGEVKKKTDWSQAGMLYSSQAAVGFTCIYFLTEPELGLSVSARYAPSQRWHIDTILHVLTTVNTDGNHLYFLTA